MKTCEKADYDAQPMIQRQDELRHRSEKLARKASKRFLEIRRENAVTVAMRSLLVANECRELAHTALDDYR